MLIVSCNYLKVTYCEKMGFTKSTKFVKIFHIFCNFKAKAIFYLGTGCASDIRISCKQGILILSYFFLRCDEA